MITPAAQSYRNTRTETLADVRLYNERHPETPYLEPHVLAARLSRPEAEVAIAQAWILSDGCEVRA